MKHLQNAHLSTMLFFALLVSIILASWFYKGNLFIGAEEGIIFYRIDYVLDKMVSTVWLELLLGMPYFSDLSKQPFYSVISYLYLNGVNPFFLQTITFFIILFGAGLSCYYLLKITFEKIYENTFIAFFGALFYLFNPYVISQVWSRGLYPQFFAFLYYPVFLLFVVLYFKTNKKIFLLFDLILSFLLSSAMGNPTYFISLWVLVGFYWIYQSLSDWKNIKHLIYIWIVFGLFFGGWLIVNAWWFFVTLIYAPSAYLVAGSAFENSLESLKAVSSQNPFLNVIRLYHGPHFDSTLYDQIYQNWFFVFLSYLGPLTIFFSLYFFKNKVYRFYLGLFVIGLFVCLGTNFPTGKIFEFVFSSFSPLQVFRNPYEKFGLIYLLAYSGLFGLGVVAIARVFNRFKRYLGSIIVGFILLLLIGINSWPLWTGDVIAWGTRVGIPQNYSEFDLWQKQYNSQKFRILFLPYLSSLGASYHWLGGDYHGNDPLYQIIDSPVITQSGLNDYLNALKRYLGSMDLTAALAMARIGFITERYDVVSVTRDKKSTEFFTRNFYSPDIEKSVEICDTQTMEEKENYLFVCELPEKYRDLSLANFIHINLTAGIAGYLDIYLEDQKGLRPRWNGQKIREYQYRPQVPGQSQIVTVYLSDPTENPDTDFSQIKNISIRFIPDDPSTNNEVRIGAINKDNGIKMPVIGIKQAGLVGGMDVYELFNPVPVGEFGTLEQIRYVTDFKTLFEEAKMVNLENAGFIMSIQNSNKELLTDVQGQKAAVERKIDNTKYFFSFPENSDSLVILNKSFNSEWKLVKGINENDLSGGFLQNINLMMKPTEAEENHYIANGYANLWRVNIGESKVAAIIYKPQVLRDILWKVSITFFGVLTLALGIMLFAALRPYHNLGSIKNEDYEKNR